MSPSGENSSLEPDTNAVESPPTSRSVSRTHSRVRNSRNTSPSSVPYLPQGPGSLVLPDGPIGEEAAELLQEFVHPHHHDAEATLVEDRIGGVDPKQNSPWWKRPSPLWFLAAVPLSTIAISGTLAPKIEIYTRLACELHKPEYTIGQGITDVVTSLADNLTSDAMMNVMDQKLCASDPVVQAAVAELTMVLVTTMGILGCITTAWWGSLSDRYGRTRVMGFCVLGLLFSDINFILVTKFSKILPGGYWFLVVSAIVEGGLGGLPTASAGIHAYMSDCADPSNRSRIFSLFLGLMFSGFAIGPTFGGLMVKFTSNLLSVFYMATGIHFAYAIGVWFLVPESLTPERMLESRQVYEETLEKAKQAGPGRGFGAKFKVLFGFLSPLGLLFSDADHGDGNPLKKKKRDLNLLFVAISYGCAVLLIGSYNYKFQYTSAVFGWTSEQIGYWLSVVGFTRAFYLTAILPLLIKLFKTKPPPIQLPIEPSEPLQPSANPPTPPPSSSSSSPPPITSTPSTKRAQSPSTYNHHQHTHSLNFDLSLARLSLLVEIISYLLLPFAPNSLAFTVFTMVGCFGAGFSPAVQSVALGLYMKKGGKESGKLFGALSVVQALCSQILGPALFGMTYVKTVSTMPAMIFFLCSAAVITAFVVLAFVRLPRHNDDGASVAADFLDTDVEEAVEGLEGGRGFEREETLVGEREEMVVPVILIEDTDERRGRKVDEP